VGEPPGQPRLVSRQTQDLAGRDRSKIPGATAKRPVGKRRGSIELLGNGKIITLAWARQWGDA